MYTLRLVHGVEFHAQRSNGLIDLLIKRRWTYLLPKPRSKPARVDHRQGHDFLLQKRKEKRYIMHAYVRAVVAFS